MNIKSFFLKKNTLIETNLLIAIDFSTAINWGYFFFPIWHLMVDITRIWNCKRIYANMEFEDNLPQVVVNCQKKLKKK